jgi:hypothetical protein
MVSKDACIQKNNQIRKRDNGIERRQGSRDRIQFMKLERIM